MTQQITLQSLPKTKTGKEPSEILKKVTLLLTEADKEITNDNEEGKVNKLLKRVAASLNEIQAMRIAEFKPYEQANKDLKLEIDKVLNKQSKGSYAERASKRLLDYQIKKKEQADRVKAIAEEKRAQTSTLPQIAADLQQRIDTLTKGLLEGKQEYASILDQGIDFEKAVEKAGHKLNDAEPLREVFNNIINTLSNAWKLCDGNATAFKPFVIKDDLVTSAYAMVSGQAINNEVEALVIESKAPEAKLKTKCIISIDPNGEPDKIAESLGRMVLQMAVDGRVLKSGKVAPWVKQILLEYARTDEKERLELKGMKYDYVQTI